MGSEKAEAAPAKKVEIAAPGRGFVLVPSFNGSALERAAADGEQQRRDVLNRGAVVRRQAEAVAGLQRMVGNQQINRLLRDTQGHSPAAQNNQPQRSAVRHVLHDAGAPLQEPLRAEMETQFGGVDFSGVRLHSDLVAQRSAAEIGARAYTSGNHVVIGEGGTDRHTLAHELSHIVQQRQGPVAGTDHGDGLRVSHPSDRFEREAEANAHRVMAGPVPVRQAAAAVEHGPDRASVRTAAIQRVNNPGEPGGKRLEDVLPPKEWYRLYLDPLHHKKARENNPENPGELYDREESPGFQASMTAAYNIHLNDPKTIGDPVDFSTYESMHNIVGSQLEKKTDVSGAKGFTTTYPLRANSPTPSVLEEVVGGKKLMVKAGRGPLPRGVEHEALTATRRFRYKEHNQTNLKSYMRNETLYKESEVKKIVTEVLDRFYGKLGAAGTPRERIKAIGWVVRTIHIIHPYDDTNRRLNVHVLLPRLLLAAGFRPVIFKDMEELFQGGRSLEQIAVALESGQAMDLLSNEIRATAPQYESAWEERNKPASRQTTGMNQNWQTTGTIQIPDFESILYVRNARQAPGMNQISDFTPMGVPEFTPSQYFGQQAAGPTPSSEGLGSPGDTVAMSESGGGRQELQEYLTQSLRQAREEAAQDPGLESTG